jgi:membrane-associated phospholipid phosphatase
MFTGVLWGIVIYRMCKSKWRLLTILIFVALFAVGFDRVYLGVHFYSQVLMSWAFAFVMVMGTGLCYKKLQDGIGKLQWTWVVFAHCCALILYLIALLLYETRDASWDDTWTRLISEVRIT